MIPGQVEPGDGEVRAGEGADSTTVHVLNTGDRPVQVGSHVHFAATNPALEFDRDAAVGMRLAISAGTSVRFEPGVEQDVTLVALGGAGVVPGLRLDVADPAGAHRGTPGSGWTVTREAYAELFGPTEGDLVRLADTDLRLRVEEDRCRGPRGGDEAVFGGGKVIRESMGQARATRAEGAPDLVITGALVLDHWGVVKADVGVRDGRIVGIGKAGNPDTMDGVTPELVIGPGTEVLAGNGKILTAGGVDCHVHFISPQQLPEALGSGVTTMIGGGTGPAEGTKATTVTPGAWYLARMFEALDGVPMNVALLGKGNTVGTDAMHEQVRAGASGFKVHEDWGATPAAIDAALRVADETGVQVALHTDTLNEAGYVDSTLAAIAGRSIHAYQHRGGRRRARAGHHHRRRAAARPAVVDQPDAPAHGQHRRRAPRHAHGLPPPLVLDPGGPGVRRVAHPGVDDRRGGPPARPRGDLDDRLGLAGDGPGRRGRPAHAGRPRTPPVAACSAPAAPPRTTTTGPGATSRSTRSARRSRTGSTRRSGRWRSASSPTSCCGTRRSSACDRTSSSRAG